MAPAPPPPSGRMGEAGQRRFVQNQFNPTPRRRSSPKWRDWKTTETRYHVERGYRATNCQRPIRRLPDEWTIGTTVWVALHLSPTKRLPQLYVRTWRVTPPTALNLFGSRYVFSLRPNVPRNNRIAATRQSVPPAPPSVAKIVLAVGAVPGKVPPVVKAGPWQTGLKGRPPTQNPNLERVDDVFLNDAEQASGAPCRPRKLQFPKSMCH